MLHGYDIKITDDDLNDSDKEEKQIDWTEDGFYYIRDFIYGLQGALYQKVSAVNNLKALLEKDSILIGENLLQFYLSQTYIQLTQKTNPLIVQKFIKIGNICDEKPLSMLILISKVIRSAYTDMPRSKLNIENLDKFKNSVLQTLMTMKDNIVKELKDSLKELKEDKKMEKGK